MTDYQHNAHAEKCPEGTDPIYYAHADELDWLETQPPCQRRDDLRHCRACGAIAPAGVKRPRHGDVEMLIAGLRRDLKAEDWQLGREPERQRAWLRTQLVALGVRPE